MNAGCPILTCPINLEDGNTTRRELRKILNRPVCISKEGKVILSFSKKFIFAEVNTDKVYWLKSKETGEFELEQIETDSVCHSIFTKSQHFLVCEDLSLNYIYLEGSSAKCFAVRRALKIVKNHVIQERPTDVKFSV